MSDYTPTTEEVERAFMLAAIGSADTLTLQRGFYKWLSAIKAEAIAKYIEPLRELKAEAWEEGNKQAHQDIDGEWPTSYTSNPYRQGDGNEPTPDS